MPTTVPTTVKSSGGHYSSLSGWEAGEQIDLQVNDRISRAECSGFPDTPAVTIGSQAAWNTDATRYIEIVAVTGAKTTANVAEAGIYKLERATGTAFSLDVNYARLDGITVKAPTAFVMQTAITGASAIALTGWAFLGDGSSYGVAVNAGTYGVTMTNCYATGYNAILHNAASATITAYNCVIISIAAVAGGIRRIGGTASVTNCYASGASGSSYQGTITKTTAASADSTGSTGLQNIAYSTSSGAYFRNVTSGSEDFRISSTSGLKGVGTDLSGTFTTDIYGATRAVPWDVGVHKFALSLNLALLGVG